MEKRTAHYSLEAIKAIVAKRGMDAFTANARDGVDQLGLSHAQAVGVVMGLTRSMLYKSMTTYADHRVWQDVYHAACPNGRLAYIKVTLISETVVVQFKAK